MIFDFTELQLANSEMDVSTIISRDILMSANGLSSASAFSSTNFAIYASPLDIVPNISEKKENYVAINSITSISTGIPMLNQADTQKTMPRRATLSTTAPASSTVGSSIYNVYVSLLWIFFLGYMYWLTLQI